jgi:hypothetical protein
MVPSWVSPKLNPCISWTAASNAADGSCAVSSQRSMAQSAPITTKAEGGHVKRGDSANTTISASTPSTHSAAIVSPPNPASCQVIEEKV